MISVKTLPFIRYCNNGESVKVENVIMFETLKQEKDFEQKQA